MSASPLQVSISIDSDGFVYIDDDQIPEGELPQVLQSISPGGSEGPDITLRADRELDYGRVMAVMGELNRAGLNRISLVTNGGQTSPPVNGGS